MDLRFSPASVQHSPSLYHSITNCPVQLTPGKIMTNGTATTTRLMICGCFAATLRPAAWQLKLGWNWLMHKEHSSKSTTEGVKKKNINVMQCQPQKLSLLLLLWCLLTNQKKYNILYHGNRGGSFRNKIKSYFIEADGKTTSTILTEPFCLEFALPMSSWVNSPSS